MIRLRNGEEILKNRIIACNDTFRMDTFITDVSYWNDEKNCPDTYSLSCYNDGHVVEIGLDEETEAKYEQWRKERLEQYAKIEQKTIDTSLRVGAMAKVFKGRKVPIGTQGIIIRLYKNQFNISALLELENKKTLWINSNNIKVKYGDDFVSHFGVYSEQCQRVVYESEFSNENAFNSQVKFLRHC